MLFNNWNAFLQARLATTDFVLNQRIAFFKGVRPDVARSDSASSFTGLITDRLDDWLVTHTSTRNLSVSNNGAMTQYDQDQQVVLDMIDEPFYSLSYDDMASSVQSSLTVGHKVGAIASIDPAVDYTPTWFIVTKPSDAPPFISTNTDDIDFIGEVGSLDDLESAIILKRPLIAGQLPKVSDFTTVRLPL